MQNNAETPSVAITPQSTCSATNESKKDKQLAAVLFLKDFVCRIDDVKRELTSLILSFPDRVNLTWSQRAAFSSIESTIIPFLSNSMTPLKDSAKLLSPISCSEYVHQFKERKRKKISHQMSTGRRLKSSPHKRIESFLKCISASPTTLHGLNRELKTLICCSTPSINSVLKISVCKSK